MRRISESKPPRRAFSFVELQVALILMGIMMVSLVPFAAVQSRQLSAVEYHWINPEVDEEDGDIDYEAEKDYWIDFFRVADGGPVYYIVPPTVEDCDLANAWVRKLGTPARVRPKVANLTDTDIEDENNGHNDIWLKLDTHVEMEVVNEVSISDGSNIELSDQSAEATVTVAPQPVSIPRQQ